MNTLKLSPVILSALLLAAHFFRIGNDAVVIVCICVPFVLLVKNKWSALLIRLFLLAGTIVWIRTIYTTAGIRIEQNESWHRMAIILGAVALFTALSALVFRIRSIREMYQL